MPRPFPTRCIGAALFTALLPASVALAQPHGGGERHGEGGGHGGAPHEEMHRSGGGFHEGGFVGHGFTGQGFASHDAGRFHGIEGGYHHYDGRLARAGFAHERFGEADWVRGGWHGRGPYLAYAGGRDSWDWRGAWNVGFWGPELSLGLGGWAWGGIAVGAGIGLIVAPPVYVLPPPIYVAPPPIVLGLPAIAPPPLMPAPPTPAVDAAPSTGDLVAAAVPPPIVVSPPPYVVAEAAPPPVVFAPARFAFAIAPPVLAFSVIGPAFYSGGYFTGGFVTSRYYGAVWDRPYWHMAVRYERPGFFGRVGASIGLGTAFGGGHYRYERVYGRNEGGWSHGERGFHEPHGGSEGHRGRERG